MTQRLAAWYTCLFAFLWSSHISFFFIYYDQNLIIAMVTLVSAVMSVLMVAYYGRKSLIDSTLPAWYNGNIGGGPYQEDK